MADQIYLARATDGNNDPVSGAEASFFATGTTTPVSVYTDETLSTLHPTPLEADGDGVFPQAFVAAGTALKLSVTDPTSGAYLPGYPRDPAIIVSTVAGAANAVSFAPILGNAATNVQTAIANITTLWNAVTTYGKSLIAAVDAAAARSTLGLGSAAVAPLLDEDSFSSDSATSVPSQQSTKAYVNSRVTNRTFNGLASTSFFESAAQTITLSSTGGIAHGLASRPKLVQAYLQCTTAELGYSVGHQVIVNPQGDSTGGSSNITLRLTNDTQITITYGSAAPVLTNLTDYTTDPITPANWRLYVRAWA